MILRIVILQPFVLSRYGMFKATVHQVLGILVVMESVYGWVKLFILESGRVPAAYDSQFEACVTNHLRDYRLRCERLVYGICMCRIVECCCENAVASYG